MWMHESNSMLTCATGLVKTEFPAAPFLCQSFEFLKNAKQMVQGLLNEVRCSAMIVEDILVPSFLLPVLAFHLPMPYTEEWSE